jgi:hypothetical protein
MSKFTGNELDSLKSSAIQAKARMSIENLEACEITAFRQDGLEYTVTAYRIDEQLQKDDPLSGGRIKFRSDGVHK